MMDEVNIIIRRIIINKQKLYNNKNKQRYYILNREQ